MTDNISEEPGLTLSLGKMRLSTSPCMIGGARKAKAIIAQSPIVISTGCSAVRVTGLANSVAEIELRTGSSVATSSQANHIRQVTGFRRW